MTGDPARNATVSTTTYDIRRRPVRFRTMRDATPGASAPADLGGVTTVVDQQLVWDAANNLVAQIDHRDGGEWPARHRPQTVKIRHDALYRVVGAEYDYTQANGTRTPVDDGTNWRHNYMNHVRDHDPMRQTPATMVSAEPPDRVVSLTWTWDYLANTTEWGDDANSFYERSLGAIANGDDLSATLRPSALYLASNIGDGSQLDGGSGWVEVDYGAGGNVAAMTVHSQCDDAPSQTCADPGGALGARRNALREGCACAVEQHYVYRWDELNRLAEARRYDRESGTWVSKVRQRYRYDASNVRTVKQTLHDDSATCSPSSAPCERIALYAYPGDFERRGLVRGTLGYEADVGLETETQYVIAGARTVWKHSSVTSGGYDREHRFTVGLTDLIQTTAAVIDVRTGELLETSTYYPNGARETYRVDSATATAPEVAGFTGKEPDEEVGVVYFGERYLIPRLGRWASPDPLHVHAVGGGEALNSYHYVGGSLIEVRDPIGLDPPSDGFRRSYPGAGATARPVPAFTKFQTRVAESGSGTVVADFRIGRGASLQVRSGARLSVDTPPIYGTRNHQTAISVHGPNASNYRFVQVGSVMMRRTDGGAPLAGSVRTSSGVVELTEDWSDPAKFVDHEPSQSRYYDECSDCTAMHGDQAVAMWDSPGRGATGQILRRISPAPDREVEVEMRMQTYVVDDAGAPVARVDWRQTVTYRFEFVGRSGCVGPGCYELRESGVRSEVQNVVTLSTEQSAEAANELRATPSPQSSPD